ncbi:MAG: hypothetical protein AMK73_08575 [Planctomycetes bacterium SM23_32]|nr:MAG: hypothetical protein AMK73_08575 [Planctomycetes bacterium SM23_32]
MASVNYGVCDGCRARVPTEHVIRRGKVYLRKNCPDCGPNEALISADAAAWQRKRELCHFDPDAPLFCTLRCETCRHNHKPRMVFMDVTNRCNMNCPICIANIPGMGFEFHPPLSYFEKVLSGLARLNPKPVVQLFGGEPTMRKDLFEIIELGRSKGLDLRIVTNGLRLADEDYCRRICDSKVHVLIAFDGRDPGIYERLRKNPGAYEKKVKALENLRKFSRHRNTIMCCVARKINDRHMRDLIDFCHESRDFIKCLHLIPLTETWEEGEFEAEISTTTEDVEQIIDEAFPEGRVEFLPMGPSAALRLPLLFFGAVPLKFGGVHPNCETATYLISDGNQFWPLSRYLKRPLDEIAEEVVSLSERLEPELSRLDPQKWLDRKRGQVKVLRAFLPLLFRSLNFRQLFGKDPWWAGLCVVGGLLIGRKLKQQVRKHSTVRDAMLMVVLPFEEAHSVEAARLQECPSAFVYEEPETGEVKTMPVCVWGLYKNEIQRKIAEKYAASSVAK